MSCNLYAKPLNPGLQASLEVTADASVTFAAYLHGDRRPVKQLRLMNLSQAGSSDGFVVERLKKLLRGFVEVLLEESVHLSAGQTSLRNFPPPYPPRPPAGVSVAISPLCTACLRPCLRGPAGCGCTRGAGGG